MLVALLVVACVMPSRAEASATAVGSSLSDPVVAPTWGPTFHAVTPTRLLDSRTALGGFGGAVGATPKELGIVGVAGVGTTGLDNVSAVVMNVTVTEGTAPSFLTVYPSGSAKPTASNINFGPGQTIANAVTVKIDGTGAVKFANTVGAVHVVADVTGWFDNPSTTGPVPSDPPPGTLYNAVGPTRLLDSRTATGGWNHKLGAGDAHIETMTIAGGNGIPLTARAVVLNVTATNSDAGSFVQLWPSDAPRPASSSINFGRGQTIANLVMTSLSATGQVSFFGAVGSTDLVVDVLGYFDPTQGANFHAMDPTRVLDDRDGTGVSGPWGPTQSRSFAVAGTHGIPATATGVVGNVTVTNGTANTFVTLGRPGNALPTTSTVNVGAHETIANAAFTGFDDAGKASAFNAAGSIDVVLDVGGYFDGDTKARPVYVAFTPSFGAAFYQLGSGTPFYTAADPASLEVPGDYDGDGRWDVAVVDHDGRWITLGTAGTIDFPQPISPVPTSTRKYVEPVPGMYDPGGKTVPAWYRDWDATWFIQGHDPIQFGEGPTDSSLPSGTAVAQTDQDVPAPGDYDGDGVTDLATFRPRTARWMIRRSSDQQTITFVLGTPGSLTLPVPADYDGIGHAQPAAYDGVSAWLIQGHATPETFGAHDWGIPGPGDFTGVGHAQLAYIGGDSSFGPTHWKVDGFASGGALTGSNPRPVTFPAALLINVARLTYLYRCTSTQPPVSC